MSMLEERAELVRQAWVGSHPHAGNRWAFFDPEGRLLRQRPRPLTYKERTVPVFWGDHLATVRQDDMDLDHVDVWRLEPQPADDKGAPECRVHQHGAAAVVLVVHVLGARPTWLPPSSSSP